MWREYILFISEKSICGFIWEDDTDYICENYILCLSAEKGYCVYLRSVYNGHFWVEYVMYFCEVDILCISEKRICVFLWSEYSFYIWKDDIVSLSANMLHCVYLFYLRRRISYFNMRSVYNIYFWKEDIVCFPGREYNVYFC